MSSASMGRVDTSGIGAVSPRVACSPARGEGILAERLLGVNSTDHNLAWLGVFCAQREFGFPGC